LRTIRSWWRSYRTYRATLVVALALAAAIEFGWLPSHRASSDVGMSYGALAALGALTATLPSAGDRRGSVGG